MKFITVLGCIFFIALCTYGQNQSAIVKGQLYVETKDTLSFDNIAIRIGYGETFISVKPDAAGNFDADVSSFPSDAYPLVIEINSILFQPYSSLVEKESFKNGLYATRIKLSPNSLEEVLVKSKTNREKKSVLLTDQKNATEMKQSIGAVELQRKASFNAAQGLVRMSGVTRMANGALYVRGLDDRYNSLTINDLPLGSPNPDNKIISLELIPSDIIKSITVYKTFNPSLNGDFVGATIAIETTDYPQKKVFEAAAQVIYNSNSTFNDFKQSTSDRFAHFTGYELEQRRIPSVYSENQLSVYQSSPGESKTLFNTSWNNQQWIAPPALSLSVRYGDNIRLNNGDGLGFYVSVKFRNKYSTQEGADNRLNSKGLQLNAFKFNSYVYETQKSGLATLTYSFKAGVKLTANVIYINNTTNSTVENFGTNAGLSVDNFFSRNNAFELSDLLAGQFFANYKSKNEYHQLSFGISYSMGVNYFPDRKLLRTLNKGAGATYITQNGIDPFVQFMFLNNQELSAYFKYVLKLNKAHSFRFGYGLTAAKYKIFNRVISAHYSSQVLSTLPAINTDNPDQFFNQGFDSKYLYYKDPPDPSKQVFIDNNIHSVYIDYLLNIGKFLFDVGVRLEQTNRDIYFRGPKADIKNDPFERLSYNPLFLMPSLNMRYTISEKANLRFTASQTITRPRLREVIPVDYQDGTGSNLAGNSALRFPSSINVDVKYDLFPSMNELLSFTVFGKYITHPIERIFIPISTGRSIQFNNFDYAYVFGIEHEVDINLGRLFKVSSLNDFSIGYNVTWMLTKVKVDTSNINNKSFAFLTEVERPLQGASEWLVNADVSYSKKIGQHWKPTISVIFNTFSERIFAVGVEGASNILEMPQYYLDVVIQNKIKERINITLALKNILNTAISFNQYATVNRESIDPTTYLTNQGINCSINFSYVF